MSSTDQEQKNEGASPDPEERTAWGHIVRGLWRSPLGLLGVSITTISITLMGVGLIAELLGLFHNPYAAMFTYTVLPGGMVLGLALIPLAAFLRRRQWHKYGIQREHLKINLSDPKHRRFLIGLLVLSVVNVSILVIMAYEGYHFTDSPYFCGVLCHQVMEPEYKAYQRSPHSKIACVECHIGPGAQWFVRAKISGLRQVVAVLTNSFSRPIPAPVHELRPARDTCEQCHWPEKFVGKKVKRFVKFSNDDQETPEVNEIALHIGGHNPETDAFEGIHWHVSKDVEVRYLATDEKRTNVTRVKVKRPDGSEDEFVKTSDEEEGEVHQGEHEPEWRLMDCIDCHNRPTHIYDDQEERVDFGLLSKRINPAIPGIREDSLEVINTKYETREEATEKMVADLMAKQQTRDPDLAAQHEDGIKAAGEYLLESYLNNVWPQLELYWGTYNKHLGHEKADEGYGCWRCHDEEHENANGDTISQDCALCHDEPE
ncbi:MAG: NapC/NirT family cytochrome c [Desulfobulbaceae bacterium]|nr:NapC/NirT family cytochrome c [Desulfobulbaceae bacterium]